MEKDKSIDDLLSKSLVETLPQPEQIVRDPPLRQTKLEAKLQIPIEVKFALDKASLIAAATLDTNENQTLETKQTDTFDNLDSVALDKAIQMYHPMDGQKSFGICSRVGSYPIMKCCESPVSPLAKEIGLGPSMFLMSTKALSILFFFLTILNLPVYLFYYQSNDYAVQSTIDFFPKVSLGNIGQAENACSSMNYVTDKKVTFTCSSNFAKLSELKYIGLIDKEASCKSVLATSVADIPDQFKSDCLYGPNFKSDKNDKYFFSDDQIEEFKKKYNDSCANKTSCSIELQDETDGHSHILKYCQNQLDYRSYFSEYLTSNQKSTLLSELSDLTANPTYGNPNVGGLQEIDTNLKDDTVPEPVILAIAGCIQDTVQIKIDSFNQEVNKNDFGIFVVVYDFLTVIILIWFVNYLNKRQKSFCEKFSDETIEMSDFCMRLSGMPKNSFFDGKETLLKSKLWNTMSNVIIDQAIAEKKIQYAGPDLVENPNYQLMDINFAEKNIGQTKILYELGQVQDKMKLEAKRICAKGQSPLESKKYNAMQSIFNGLREKYYDACNPETSGKQYTAKIAPKNGKQFDPNKKPYIYGFITTRSMDGVELLENAYKEFKSPSYRCCIKFWSLLGCCKENYRRVKMREIDDTWPYPEIAILPDNINWQNMGYGPKNRFLRSCVIWIIAIVIIILAFSGILYFQGLQTKLGETFTIVDKCPVGVIKKTDAVQDIHQLPKYQQGLMHCYCFDQLFHHQNKDTLQIDFTDVDEDDNNLYCKQWFEAYGTLTAIKQGAPIIIAVINVVACTVFDLMSSFEKKYTKNDATVSTFVKITILQFFNISVVILLVSFNLKFGLFNVFGIFVGDYTDFSVDWYKQIGATLTMTMLINCVSPHVSKIAMPLLACLKRCLDRGCKYSYQPDQAKGETELRTKKVLQQDVETLYIGEEIASFYVYAQFFTTLWSVLTFSSGIPVLYPVAFLNYLILYWVYKILLIKYYRKTVSFNQDLPNFSIYFFKVGIVFHIIMGAFIFSNDKVLKSNLLTRVSLQDDLTQTLQDEYNQQNSGFIMMIIERFTSGIGMFYLILMILIIVFYILKLTVGTLLMKIFEALFKILCCCCIKSQKQLDADESHRKALAQAQGLDVHSQDILTDFRIGPLNDKFQKSRKELNTFRKLKSTNPELFDGVDREILHNQEKNLNRRVAAQMGVIDFHINLLCQEMDQEASGGFLPAEYKELPYDLKLKLLIANEPTLLERQKNTNEPILRMKGLTQSYFMYDSVTYQKANAMIKQLETDASKAQVKLNTSAEAVNPGEEDIEMIPVKPKGDGVDGKQEQKEENEVIEGNAEQIIAQN